MKHMRKHVLKAILAVALLMVFVVPSFAMSTNGSFETGDFTGWGSFHSGSGSIFVATSSPGIGDGSLPSDGITDGIYAAYSDAAGPNTSVIWQDVAGGGSMSVDITYNNSAGSWAFTGILDETSGPNQYFRIDIMDPAAASTSMAAGDIYMTVFASSAATPLSTDKQTFSADLSTWAGQTVRIRIAQGDNLFFFPFVVDNLVVIPAAAGLNVPHVTDIRINAGSNVPAYDSAAGSQAKLSGGDDIFLPQDFDGNGFDTYVVTDTAVVDGVTWYSIFLGSESFVWVNGSQVILQ